MKPSIAVVLALLLVLSGCSFQLGTAFSEQGQTQAELDVANMACRHEAEMAWEGNFWRQLGAFIEGLTIIGLVDVYFWERSVKRETWQSCMRARGYRVVPPN